jgi:hypothetical protein
MSQPGPVIIVSDEQRSDAAQLLKDSRLFPLVETPWADAPDAIERVRPSAIIVSAGSDPHTLDMLAREVDRLQPYTALIVIDPVSTLPPNALPFTGSHDDTQRFNARLNAALRVRALHATVLRRLQDVPLSSFQFPSNDPLTDATALLVGRSGSFPALSVALGERMGVVGALSIEAAANHLNTRAVDGVFVGEGFSPRVVDAFLQVLSEDSRFRNLPVIVMSGSAMPSHFDLPNLEVVSGETQQVVANALPMIRQNALESRLNRALNSLDAGGLLDPRTGLLTQTAFDRDFDNAIKQAHSGGAGLSIAKFTFATQQERSRLDAARILGRLMRRMDFATLQKDGSITVVFAGADSRDARLIARRLASVLKQTAVSSKANGKLATDVALTSLLPDDTRAAIMSRLDQKDHRAAS